MESRPYWPREAYLSAGSHGCAEGARQAPGVPVVGADTAPGTGWALAIPISGCPRQVGGGRGTTHPPVPHLPHHPGYYPPAHPSDVSIPVHPVTAETVSLRSTKEILGVGNALLVYRSVPHASP